MAYQRSSPLLKILATFVLLAVCCNTYAQDILAQIASHQERIEKLENDFITSQRRILASASTSSAQDLTFDQLNAVGNLLGSANREFSALTQSLMLAALVTDKRALPQAKRIVENQKDFMVKRMQSAVEYTEKTLLRAKDPETNRLLLEARDIFRASAEFVGRMKVSEPKGSPGR